MKKMSIAYQALTHARAYAYEHAKDTGYITDDYDFDDNNKFVRTRTAEPIFDIIDHCKTIKELNHLLKTYVGIRIKRTDVFTASSGADVNGFYQAMKKTIPLLLNEKNKTWEHSGTECRGWYRVWGSIKRYKSYFCSFDVGRDQWMAESFYKAGAITEFEYNRYKTNMTLRLMINNVDENGYPDVKEIRNLWKKECQEEVLDMRLIRMLESN